MKEGPQGLGVASEFLPSHVKESRADTKTVRVSYTGQPPRGNPPCICGDTWELSPSLPRLTPFHQTEANMTPQHSALTKRFKSTKSKWGHWSEGLSIDRTDAGGLDGETLASSDNCIGEPHIGPPMSEARSAPLSLCF